jgi:hypothetical protein
MCMQYRTEKSKKNLGNQDDSVQNLTVLRKSNENVLHS